MITGGDIVLPGGNVLEGGTVLVNQGVIQDIVGQAPASLLLEEEDVSVIDATGYWVTPGLIDQHLHGAFGVDFNQSPLESIHDLLYRLPQYGITGVLPTLMTAPKLDLVMGLTKMEEVIHTLSKHQARVFGIHLEGPFLHPKYRGAHPQEDLLEPTPENLEGLLSPNLKRITLAPELDPQGEVIQKLTEMGVLCSIGHSGANFETAMAAIAHGACCATHLYNAMSRFHHREDKLVIAALLYDDLFVELIADGKHISPLAIQLALKVKPFERTILISDCNALTGMNPGDSMMFGKQKVVLQDGTPTNEEGKLAGSAMMLTDCVRNLVAWEVLPFPHAVQMATLHPALHLGLSSLFGQIEPGVMADLVLWNQDDLSIAQVFLAGEAIPMTPATPSQLA